MQLHVRHVYYKAYLATFGHTDDLRGFESRAGHATLCAFPRKTILTHSRRHNSRNLRFNHRLAPTVAKTFGEKARTEEVPHILVRRHGPM